MLGAVAEPDRWGSDTGWVGIVSADRPIPKGENGVGMILSITGILGALAVGAISPGPSFVFVARTSTALSRRDGVAAAPGMGVGGVIFGAIALLGLHVILASVDWLYFGFKLLGGLYLLYLAFRLWRSASDPIVVSGTTDRPAAPLNSFVLGLMTQLSNPKTAVVYGSIFAALLPTDVPVSLFLILLPLILLLEAGWYSVVALAFSSHSPRAAYLRTKSWIDRAAGAVMGSLGLKLMVESR